MRRALVATAGRLCRGSGGSSQRPPSSLVPSASVTAVTGPAAASTTARPRPRCCYHDLQQQRRSITSSPRCALPAAATAPSGRGKKDAGSGQVMNEAIKTERVRLVVKDEATGKSTTEVVARDAALAKARQLGLDLVLVSKASEPWVCKLLDARKEEYLRQKKERQRSKASKATALKELAIRGNISDHDLLIKLRRVTDFFAQGHSVRLILLPTSSQMSRRPTRLLELRDFILNDFLANKTKSVVEIQPPTPTSPRRELILHPKRPPTSQPQQQQSPLSGGKPKPAAAPDASAPGGSANAAKKAAS